VETKSRAAVERRRLTVEEYHQTAEVGILHEDDRVELIEGGISTIPIDSRHVACVTELIRLLGPLMVGGEVVVSPQNPVRLGENLELQPDISVLKLREKGCFGRSPGPEDVLLLIEVSDTSVSYDRGEKLSFYVRAGIPEAWILDLAGETVDRHNEPSQYGYRRKERARRGEGMGSETLPSLLLQVYAVLGH
jgi:Uma2 family endonuclease